MAYDVATTGLLEEALSEAFQYHRELDNFLLRAGVRRDLLQEARERADARASTSPRGFAKAPKRYVAQEILATLADQGESGDAVLASLVNGLAKSNFPNASPSGREAVEALGKKLADERAARADERKAKEHEEQARAAAARRAKEAELLAQERARASLCSRFTGLMAEENSQRRGYLLEAFLSDFFEYESLDPRRSFKITGEQIDGSFMWRQRSNLVECKWTQEKVAGVEFGAFQFKIEGKSADTRGLFISINGYSGSAISALNGKGALKFVCLDGSHLMRALSGGESLSTILTKAWRHADETGEAYLHVSKL
jgi:hypothetical protein